VRLFRRDAVIELCSLGSYLSVLQLAQALGIYADPFILTAILGPSAVALYRAGTALPSRIQPFVRVADQLHPFATAYHVSAQRTRLQETLVRGTRYTLLLGILPCVVLGVFAEPIARFWLARSLGPDYRLAARVLACWSVVELLVYTAGAQWPVLVAMKKLGFVVRLSLPLAVLNLAASACLVAWTPLGVVGAVVATIVIGVISRPIMIVYTARACGLSPMAYVRGAYLGPLVVLMALGAWATTLLRLGVADTLPGLAAAILGTGVAWLALTWCLGCTREDRRSFRDLGRRLAEAILPRPCRAILSHAAAVDPEKREP
jgi:O-antigen/teichoic acid export membrane protein